VAIAFAVPHNEVPTSVQLTVAAQSGTFPGSGLQACPLVSAAFTVAFGGPIADAPAADCTKSINGSLNSGGTTWSFPVAGLTHEGQLALELVPSGPVTRVVLAKPTDASLLFQTVPAGGTTPSGTGVTPPLDGWEADAPSVGLTAPPLPQIPLVTPQVAPSATVGPTDPPATSAALAITFVPTTRTSAPASAALGLLVVGLLARRSWKRRPATRPLLASPSQTLEACP
jgi:hypothetical protein